MLLCICTNHFIIFLISLAYNISAYKVHSFITIKLKIMMHSSQKESIQHCSLIGRVWKAINETETWLQCLYSSHVRSLIATFCQPGHGKTREKKKMAETAAKHNKRGLHCVNQAKNQQKLGLDCSWRAEGNAQTEAVVTEPYSYLTAC